MSKESDQCFQQLGVAGSMLSLLVGVMLARQLFLTITTYLPKWRGWVGVNSLKPGFLKEVPVRFMSCRRRPSGAHGESGDLALLHGRTLSEGLMASDGHWPSVV